MNDLRSDMFRLLPAPWQLADLPKDTPVLLAFSGGSDSAALLSVLVEQSKRDGFPLTAAHLHHGIRGEEADRDELFCRKTAEGYGVPYCCKRVSVPELANAEKCGLEEMARKIRYQWLGELMEERNIPILVTAHHADDQLETVLFRLCRGTGLKGLCGMRRIRKFGNGVLVRPFLEIPKSEISDYCKDRKIAYVTDSTNADTAYSRNRLRVEVIPVLESLFPNVSQRVGKMTDSLSEDADYLEAQANAVSADGSLNGWKTLPSPILKRILEKTVFDATGKHPEAIHLEQLERLIRSGVSGDAVSLPGDHRAVLSGDRMQILPDGWRKKSDGYEFEAAFGAGETVLPEVGWKVLAQKQDAGSDRRRKNDERSEAGTLILRIGSAQIKKAVWRSPREGDRILSGGMHRRLQTLFREAGIGKSERKNYPMLCLGEEILWIPFVRRADRIAPSGEDEIWKIKVIKKQDQTERTDEYVSDRTGH